MSLVLKSALQQKLDDLAELAVGPFFIFIGILFIYNRGFSYWMPWQLFKFPQKFYRAMDLICGILWCLFGVLATVLTILKFFR